MAPGTRAGTVIENKYRLDEQIGHGGMGAVYKGIQLAVDRPVAIKLLHPNFAGHDKLQARFEVEAKAIARLNHPNCITLFDFGYSEDMEAFYTVVEFIDGTPLEALINQRPSISRVVDLIRQISSALGHAHHHGILHRDLKPENIMIAQMTDGSEMVKVLDFGIAQIMKGNTDDDDDFEADRLTRVGEVFGTPPYMSPEQAQSSRDLTPAADLYSLGIIFYELLEGRLPFFADSPMEILGMHINDAPPPLKRADVSNSLQSVVLKMLEKRPEDRPQTGGQVIELLDAIPAEELSEKSPSIRAPGNTRPSEPTLMSPPVDKDTTPDSGEHLPLNHPTLLSDVDEPDPEAKSVILELRDIVPDDQIPDIVAPPGEQYRISASADATGTMPVATDFDAPRSAAYQTQMLDDGISYLEDQERKRNKRTLIIITTLIFILVSALGIWMANSADDGLSAAEQSSLTSPSGEELNLSASDQSDPSGESDEFPLEVSVAEADEDEDGDGDEQSPGGEVEEFEIDEEEVRDSPPPTRPPTRRQPPAQRQPDPAPSRSSTQEDSTPPVRLHVDEQDDDGPRRPARLGL